MNTLMLRNTSESYGLVAQVLHWATAALILVLLPLGLFMHELPESSAADVAYKAWFYSLHKTLGVTVFAVAVVRVIWAAIQPHPKLLNAERKLESLAAQTIHWMLYGAIICMPLTGWLHHSASVGFAPIWWPLPQDLPLVPKDPQLATFFGIAHFSTGILLWAHAGSPYRRRAEARGDRQGRHPAAHDTPAVLRRLRGHSQIRTSNGFRHFWRCCPSLFSAPCPLANSQSANWPAGRIRP